MILVDTSIWVDHLRAGDRVLSDLLENSMILSHPWVTGELALGNLSRRDEILPLLANLPEAEVATTVEVAHLIEQERLYGLGVGYVDAQLLAATRLTPDAKLWTRDRRLHRAATRLGFADATLPEGEEETTGP